MQLNQPTFEQIKAGRKLPGQAKEAFIWVAIRDGEQQDSSDYKVWRRSKANEAAVDPIQTREKTVQIKVTTGPSDQFKLHPLGCNLGFHRTE